MPHSIGEALATDYARLLPVKVTLFAMMLLLAALNRFVMSPRLAAAADGPASGAAILALRRSVLAENGLAVLVLLAVAALGVMEPPSAL